MDPAKAYLLPVDDDAVEITPANGATFALKELQTYVGGYIQIERLDAARVIVLNDDGLSLDLPSNELATVLAPHLLTESRGIVGPVVVCPTRMVD